MTPFLSSKGLVIVDVTDPKRPGILGSCYDGGMAQKIQVSGSYAYIANYYSGLEMMDIGNPQKPVKVGKLGDGGHAFSLDVVDNFVYLADVDDGLEIIDVTNPVSPRKIKTIPGTRGVTDVQLEQDYLYLYPTLGTGRNQRNQTSIKKE